jgi:hypothetical protein
MALSLREKLQKASLATIATNAAKTLAKLDVMERSTPPLGKAPVALSPQAVSDEATQQATQQATQRPSHPPNKRPSRRPSDPATYPAGDPAGDPATQSATHRVTHPVSDPVNHPAGDPQDDPVNHPLNTQGIGADLWETLTGPQKKVLLYLAAHQGEIIRYADIAQAGAMPPATVQTICRRLKNLGVLSSHYGSRGVIKGIRFSLEKKIFQTALRQNDPVSNPVSNPQDDPAGDPGSDPPSSPPSHPPTQQATQQATPEASNVLIDRKKNLSLSSCVLQTTWPHLARCGFGLEQLRQAVENLTALGKPTDRLVQGMDHIEFELEHGQLVDKGGQVVADPCSWAFRALAQNGYYRRPKGYVSAEEQALRDAEQEARALLDARQKAEQAQFEAWRDGLGEEALAEAMRGSPGGPKDVWLKRVWKERGK